MDKVETNSAAVGQPRREGQSSPVSGGVALQPQDAVATAKQAVLDAAGGARDMVSGMASEAQDMVSGLLDERVSGGRDVLAKLADVGRTAANSLQSDAPDIARLIRSGLKTLDNVSAGIEGKSAAELLAMANNYARRNPYVTFAVAVTAGMALSRVLKVSAVQPSGSAPGSSFGSSSGSAQSRNRPTQGRGGSEGVDYGSRSSNSAAQSASGTRRADL